MTPPTQSDARWEPPAATVTLSVGRHLLREPITLPAGWIVRGGSQPREGFEVFGLTLAELDRTVDAVDRLIAFAVEQDEYAAFKVLRSKLLATREALERRGDGE